MKTKERKEKKDTPKNEFIIEENHRQFSRIFTNNVVAKKIKVKKKNLKKKFKQKKKNLVTLKNKKEMFFWTKFD